MGLLSKEGQPLNWNDPEHAKWRPYVKEHGVLQFLQIYKNYQSLKRCPFLWGDEVEMMLIWKDPASRTVKLLTRAGPVLEELEAKGKNQLLATAWRPEYASYMLEATPPRPFSGQLDCILSVEASMKARMTELQNQLGPNESAVLLSNFPLLGVGDFLHPSAPRAHGGGDIAKSLFIP
eukprot:gene3846-4231_t